MKCPSCTETALVMGVEIDYCPQCRAVWLDRGELDELTERSTTIAQAPTAGANVRSQPQFADSDDNHGRGLQGGREKSWLKDIFD